MIPARIAILATCALCIATAILGYFQREAAIASLIYRTSLAALLAYVALNIRRVTP